MVEFAQGRTPTVATASVAMMLSDRRVTQGSERAMPRLRPSKELEAAQKQIEADLQADLENGATLYGY